MAGADCFAFVVLFVVEDDAALLSLADVPVVFFAAADVPVVFFAAVDVVLVFFADVFFEAVDVVLVFLAVVVFGAAFLAAVVFLVVVVFAVADSPVVVFVALFDAAFCFEVEAFEAAVVDFLAAVARFGAAFFAVSSLPSAVVWLFEVEVTRGLSVDPASYVAEGGWSATPHLPGL
ncbi:hypothetical protein HDA30_000911 [Micrococcus cohnii]|uniref:Uncharacterized protein n=1 Tax=Micrococcus cohnii TaxID=993416 RepID=A0A7W7GNH5_9MICC|nr:hypothetical protein [Micrococcus cohnii]